jgi:holo-[acyl-carrier protein] synthase
MIYGIGTDIVVISRVRDLLARWGDRFPRRVLGPDELREYQRRHSRGTPGPERAVRYLAKRFAAKEAFSKAIGLGLRGPMTLLSLQVLNDPRGRPVAVARNALATLSRERRGDRKARMASVTHTSTKPVSRRPSPRTFRAT